MSHFTRKSILIILAIFVVSGTIIFVDIQRSSVEFENKLDQSIADILIQDLLNIAKKGYEVSLEGSVVVKIQSGTPLLRPSSWRDSPYISIWKYEKGILKPASDIDFEQVKRDGNAFLFVFAIQKIEASKAFVDIATYYPYIHSETKGFYAGGNASHYIFEYIHQKWYEIDKKLYWNWD